MKKNILLTICILWLPLAALHSQNPTIYIPGTIIEGEGFAYICDSPIGLFVRIYNEENYLVDLEQTLRNGDQIPTRDGIHAPLGFVQSGQMEGYYKFKIIIDDVLSDTEKYNADDEWLLMDIGISSDTGRIVGVEFSFDPDKKGFSQVSPEHYHEIETRMKEEIIYQIDSIGRTYNYCRTVLFFNGNQLSY